MAIKKKLPKAEDGGAYVAWKNGKLTRNYGGSDAYINKSMDTTGYSKGKQEFDFNRSTFNDTPGAGRKTVTTKVSRTDVPSKIAELKKNSNRTVIESKKKANSFTITENKPVTKSVKKPLPKQQFGGSGILGIPTFDERQQRKTAKAKAKATRAEIEGYDSVADKKDARANRISKVLGTARNKIRSVFGNGNNVGNTVDSYNKGSYNKDSFNNSSSYSGRPESIMQSQPSGFQNNTKPSKTYGPPRIVKKGGIAKKK